MTCLALPPDSSHYRLSLLLYVNQNVTEWTEPRRRESVFSYFKVENSSDSILDSVRVGEWMRLCYFQKLRYFHNNLNKTLVIWENHLFFTFSIPKLSQHDVTLRVMEGLNTIENGTWGALHLHLILGESMFQSCFQSVHKLRTTPPPYSDLFKVVQSSGPCPDGHAFQVLLHNDIGKRGYLLFYWKSFLFYSWILGVWILLRTTWMFMSRLSRIKMSIYAIRLQHEMKIVNSFCLKKNVFKYKSSSCLATTL